MLRRLAHWVLVGIGIVLVMPAVLGCTNGEPSATHGAADGSVATPTSSMTAFSTQATVVSESSSTKSTKPATTSSAPLPSSTSTSARPIQEKQPEVLEKLGKGIDDPTAFLASAAAEVGSGPLEVPVYREAVLTTESEGCFSLGMDNGFYRNFGLQLAFFERLQMIFPSEAIRRTADGGSVYVMYDTDAGGRLYVFFSGEKNNYMVEDGFPILMKKRLTHADFAGLAVGDGIGDVERIDPAASVYKSWFGRLNDTAITNWTALGAPPTSVHLLTDGILKIEYRGDPALGYAITSIIYDEDFILDGFDGETCYRIDPADYAQ